MKTINLDLDTARSQLEDIDIGEQFFTIQKSRDGKVVAVGSFDEDGVYKVNGYFFERDGELVDEEFSDEYFEYWIDVALGNEGEL